MVNIFIDTNIFLHFISFTEIEWAEIVGDTQFQIIVPLTVISELDKKKTHPNKKISERAKSTLDKIHKVIDGEKLGQLEILLPNTRPSREVYSTNDLSSDEPDDRILAAIIDFDSMNKKILVSNDTAIRVRATHFGIDYKKVPEKYAVIDTNEEEKEIKNLKKQLKNATETGPELRLRFNNQSNLIKMTRKPENEGITEDQYVAREDFNIKLKPMDLNDPFLHLEHQGIERGRNYNRQYKDYREDCLRYFKDSYYYALYTSKTYELNLVIDNIKGNAPAKNVEIALVFPTGVQVSEHHLETPQIPSPPSHTAPIMIVGHLHDRKRYYSLNYSNIFSRKKNKMIFTFPDLKHHKHLDLPPIFVTFNDTVQNINIEYTVLADNLAQKIEGKLNVVIQ